MKAFEEPCFSGDVFTLMSFHTVLLNKIDNAQKFVSTSPQRNSTFSLNGNSKCLLYCGGNHREQSLKFRFPNINITVLLNYDCLKDIKGYKPDRRICKNLHRQYSPLKTQRKCFVFVYLITTIENMETG